MHPHRVLPPPLARPPRGVIFDLDGTLADSGLDFEAMRREMGLLPGQPILEALARLPEPEAARCRAILDRHEWEGARRARAMPGAAAFVEHLNRRGLLGAVLSRNARAIVEATLDRLGLAFDRVLGREDGPAKPDPTLVERLCAEWRLAPDEVVLVGDYVFDIEAGRRAGTWTVLYTAGRDAEGLPGADRAHFHLRCFQDSTPLLAWLGLL